MQVIGFAVNLYQLCTFGSCNGAHEGIKPAGPLGIDEASAIFGAPCHMEIYTEKFACHALYN